MRASCRVFNRLCKWGSYASGSSIFAYQHTERIIKQFWKPVKECKPRSASFSLHWKGHSITFLPSFYSPIIFDLFWCLGIYIFLFLAFASTSPLISALCFVNQMAQNFWFWSQLFLSPIHIFITIFLKPVGIDILSKVLEEVGLGVSLHWSIRIVSGSESKFLARNSHFSQ